MRFVLRHGVVLVALALACSDTPSPASQPGRAVERSGNSVDADATGLDIAFFDECLILCEDAVDVSEWTTEVRLVDRCPWIQPPFVLLKVTVEGLWVPEVEHGAGEMKFGLSTPFLSEEVIELTETLRYQESTYSGRRPSHCCGASALAITPPVGESDSVNHRRWLANDHAVCISPSPNGWRGTWCMTLEEGGAFGGYFETRNHDVLIFEESCNY